ncbi:deoxyribose-phosphate aldolase [uncultured Nonlabens sp.]|jgi:deoxyribose-phosphate aldolase|uniref:deoxyribose-phosphate aldolase n=1 Tax=uncultured Nonlabens sp. TaxID=859306 RepID=UPI0030D99988|tara:strand:- start:23164 stop:23808 length:645 start_codon:yes stop_codon:yes gene_type:complete
MNPINTYIDHTQIKATTTPEEISQLCKEAVVHQFYAVCIAGFYTAFAKAELEKTSVKIATVIGFPLGADTTATKVFETQEAIANGTHEIDMVLNIGVLKAGYLKQVKEDIAAVRKASQNEVLKVIFENCYLTEQEKRNACQICLDTGVDFIKTSTGFGTGGATVKDIKLIKEEVANRIKIEASGKIKTLETALLYIKLGADRIGTSYALQMIKK